MEQGNNNNLTFSSFTVEDDLISQTSLNTTFVQPRSFKPKPFTKDFGPKGAAGINHFDERPVPTIQKKIMQQAHNDAYRQLNNDLYNPFQHKLQNVFAPQEGNLYQREKQRQIQLIKKREEEMVNSTKNYTIIINNNSQGKSKSLQLAGSNIINQDSVPSISDYYQKKFKKKEALESVTEEEETEVKKNNFIQEKNSRKVVKKQIPRVESVQKERIVKSDNGWKRESTSEKQIQDVSANRPEPREPKQTYTPTIPKPPPKRDPPKQIPKPAPKTNIQPKAKTQGDSRPSKNEKKDSKGGASKGKKKYSEVYQGPDRNLVEQLQNQITQCPTITFQDIAQLQTAKGLLQEAVLLPRMMPEFFKGIRKATRGILLFGPPGTGKTLLAKAIASNGMFFNVSAASLASKWKGQSEKMVRLLFEMARYHSPSVIFFDEIDCIASKRSENEHQSARKVKTQLLVQMDGAGSSEQPVFVLAATNRPWDLDEALRRRLEKRIYIPLPGKEGRKKLFGIHLRQLKVAGGVDWDSVVKQTEGCSGADICNICRDAAYMPMRRRLIQVGGIAQISQLSQAELLEEEVSQLDLMEAVKKVRPSVGAQDLKRYADWMKQFGSS